MSADLGAFRDAVLAEAREHARQVREQAGPAADEQLRAARVDAAALVDEAQREGREAAQRQQRHERSEARRENRETVLAARGDAVEQLRYRVLEHLDQARDGAAYDGLLGRLETVARRQLGGRCEVEEDTEAGGVLATAGGRRVDYRLPTLVERALADLGSELEELWR